MAVMEFMSVNICSMLVQLFSHTKGMARAVTMSVCTALPLIELVIVVSGVTQGSAFRLLKTGDLVIIIPLHSISFVNLLMMATDLST